MSENTITKPDPDRGKLRETKTGVAGEMTQRVRACAALSENPSSAPSTHFRWLTTPCDSSSSGLGVHNPHLHKYTHKNKYKRT